MKNSASWGPGACALSYASLCARITNLWAGVIEESSTPSQGVAEAEGTCHLADMVVVLAASEGVGAKDHHVARAPPPTDALSPMETLGEILHQQDLGIMAPAARCKRGF